MIPWLVYKSINSFVLVEVYESLKSSDVGLNNE